jgi:hypothetical protein
MKDTSKQLNFDTAMQISSRNTQAFCLNLVYSSACTYTVQAYQKMASLPQTPETKDDMKFYLETLFSQPYMKDL